MGMADFWDRAAREDAEYFVDDRGLRGEEFWRGGEEVVRVFEELLDFEARAATIVEIGCGVGRITRVLAARATTVVAIDVSAEMLTRARAANPELANVRWVHGDGLSLSGVADGSAEGVFSHVVFQHVPDPEVTLGYVREIGRVLAPGGWAAFQVSDDPAVHHAGDGAKGQADPAWIGSAVDLEELRAVAVESGMAVERIVGASTQFCLVRLLRP